MTLVVHSLQDPCTRGTRKCNLCLTDKLASMKADSESVLKTFNDLVFKCIYTDNSH